MQGAGLTWDGKPFPFAGLAGGGMAPIVTGKAIEGVSKGMQDDSPGWGSLALDVGKDIALGSNPITGVPYYGYKAFKDFKDGNFWSGLGNVGWGALSFLPGAGSIKGIGKGLFRAGLKGLGKGVMRGSRALKMAPGTRSAVMKGGLGAGLTGMGGDMMWGGSPEQAAPQPTQQPAYQYNPYNPTNGNSVSQVMSMMGH